MKIFLKTFQFTFKLASRTLPRLTSIVAIDLVFRTRRPKNTQEQDDFWEQGIALKFKSGCRGRMFGKGKKTIFIVHGWHSSGARFMNMTKSFLEAGHRVVLWDGPGHGDSPGKKTHLAEFSDYLTKDLEALSSDIDLLVAHSFGGAAAAEACKRGVKVDKLVLISTPSSGLRLFNRIMNVLGLVGRAREYFVERLEEKTQMTLKDMSSEQFVLDLPQKILLIHDLKDKTIPAGESKSLAARRRDIILMITTGFGHHRILEQKHVHKEILKFFTPSKEKPVIEAKAQPWSPS